MKKLIFVLWSVSIMHHIFLTCKMLCLLRIITQLVLVPSAHTVKMVSVLEVEGILIMNALKTGKVTSAKVRSIWSIEADDKPTLGLCKIWHCTCMSHICAYHQPSYFCSFFRNSNLCPHAPIGLMHQLSYFGTFLLSNLSPPAPSCINPPFFAFFFNSNPCPPAP